MEHKGIYLRTVAPQHTSKRPIEELTRGQDAPIPRRLQSIVLSRHRTRDQQNLHNQQKSTSVRKGSTDQLKTTTKTIR